MNQPNHKTLYTEPLIFNAYKPPGDSSLNLVRHFKRNLPKGYGKIGHFGTLDPFACGVLMIGVNGAAKLNNYIHEYLPKTYIATGILGLETETGDMTVEPSQQDDSEYLKTEIASFSDKFIENICKEKFLGQYFQAPHKYSAAKFEGKALHRWAREGVEIKKEKKEKTIYKIEVVEYNFPKLTMRFEVSSGTYIRTLFSDCANALGTIGVLDTLEREKVGGCDLTNAIYEENWPKVDSVDWDISKYGLKADEVLDFGDIILASKEANLYKNGVKLKSSRVNDLIQGQLETDLYWVRDENRKILGLARLDEHINIEFNFN